MKTIWKANPDRQEVETRPEWFTYLHLSQICVKTNGDSLTKQGVRKRARRERWRHTKAKGPGGWEDRIRFDDLPEDIRMAIREYYGELPENDLTAEVEELNRATEAQRNHVARWGAVLEAWEEWSKANEGQASKKELRGEFVELVKQAKELEETIIPGLHWKICRDIRRISVRTLERHETKLRGEGKAALIRRQGGHNRGATNIPPEQQDRIKGIMSNEPDWGAKRIATRLKAEFGASAAKKDSVRWYMARLRREDPGYYDGICRGMEKYKNKFQPASGRADAKPKYPLHYIEMDSTVSDVVCNDGKRYVWIGAIDVFSRKAIFKLFPRSNRYGVLSVLADVIQKWGIPENVVMDNGLDYQSKAVQGALKNLGAHGIKLLPYAPDEKGIIERMMGTRAQFEEILPGFVGHNVKQQQEIRSRRNPRGKSRPVNTMETNLYSRAELEAEYARHLEKVYHNKPHKGLKGMTPNEKWASSAHKPTRVKSPEQALIMILLPEERIMQKDGLHFGGCVYWHSDLSCEVGKTFMCRQYPMDISLLCVSTPEPEEFVCWAKDTEVYPVTRADAIRDRRHALKAHKDRYNREAGLAGEMYRNPRAEEFAMAQDQRAKVQPLHAGGPTVSGVVAEMAYAAGEDLEKLEERRSIFAEDSEHYSEPRRTPLHIVGGPEDEEPKTSRFRKSTAAIDRVRDFLMERKRKRLTPDEENQARQAILRCLGWLQSYIHELDRDDQAWIAKIVPEHFREYAEDQRLRHSL